MCGIWASIGIRGAETALAALVHRGPDAGNIQCFDINRLSVELGHRRLAILDPTPRSDEPISTNDRNYWLTFNGEIYKGLSQITPIRCYNGRCEKESAQQV